MRGAAGASHEELFVRVTKFPEKEVVAKADGSYVSSSHQRGWRPRTCTTTNTPKPPMRGRTSSGSRTFHNLPLPESVALIGCVFRLLRPVGRNLKPYFGLL